MVIISVIPLTAVVFLFFDFDFVFFLASIVFDAIFLAVVLLL